MLFRKTAKRPKRKAKEQRQYNMAARNVFSTFSGEMLMEYLEDVCFFWDTTMVPGDPIATVANEARRELLLDLKEMAYEKAKDKDDETTDDMEENYAPDPW